MFEMQADTSGMREYADMLKRAGAQLKNAALGALEKQAEKLLAEVSRRVEAYRNVDTGALLASFTKGGADNVYKKDVGGLSIEVGTEVEYAEWVNTGHYQRPGRFIPGEWNGDKFQYIPGHKTGMTLKADWVEGSYYFDDGVAKFAEGYDKDMMKEIAALFEGAVT